MENAHYAFYEECIPCAVCPGALSSITWCARQRGLGVVVLVCRMAEIAGFDPLSFKAGMRQAHFT